MKLSDIPFSDLSIGDIVIGVNGVEGTITDLIPKHLTDREIDDTIIINWANGNVSHVWHMWTTKVTYVVAS